MESQYNAEGNPLSDRPYPAPKLPEAVIATAKRKEIPLDTLRYDALCKFWFPADGWKGMFLGIEPDGHAHT